MPVITFTTDDYKVETIFWENGLLFIKVRENLKIDGMLEGVNDDSMSVHIQKPKDGLVVCTHFPLTN